MSSVVSSELVKAPLSEIQKSQAAMMMGRADSRLKFILEKSRGNPEPSIAKWKWEQFQAYRWKPGTLVISPTFRLSSAQREFEKIAHFLDMEVQQILKDSRK